MGYGEWAMVNELEENNPGDFFRGRLFNHCPLNTVH